MSVHQYKYFLLGNAVPVRVTFNDRGHKLGAEIPSPEKKTLEIDFDILRRVEESPEVDEIDQKAFDSLCAEIYSKKKNSVNFTPS